MDIEQTGCYRSIAYVLLILLFMLNSGLVRVSGNVLLNKSLDVLFFTVAAVVGYGVLLLFEKF